MWCTPCTIRMDLFPQSVQLKFFLSQKTLAGSACWSLHSHMQLKVGVRHCFPTPLLFTWWFITVPHEWVWLWSNAVSGCDCGVMLSTAFTPVWGCSEMILTPSLDLVTISGILFLIAKHRVDLAFIHCSPKDFPWRVWHLCGRNTPKRTQIQVHLLERLSEALTYRIWAVLFGSPLDCVLSDFLLLLNSIHHIIIPILRSGVPHNCSQGQQSLMVLLSVAALYRKARTEKNLGNVWKRR